MKLVIILILLFFNALAQADYSNHPDTKEFIKAMAAMHLFDERELIALFRQVDKKQSILEAISRPAERKVWYQYRPIFLSSSRAKKGAKYWHQHSRALADAKSIYGVPPEIIMAIVGVETNYGSYTGKFRVIDALATLAFDYPKRSPFFTQELEHFLLLSREEGWLPLSILGSYAGAMGLPQFMPSSYRRFSVDFNGDEVRDLHANPMDVIGSVANYFKSFGWEQGQPITIPVTISSYTDLSLVNDDRYTNSTVADLKAQGIQGLEGFAPEMPASLILLTQESGPEYWVAFKNFYVITEYNHSILYAMAVYQLSQEIIKYY